MFYSISDLEDFRSYLEKRFDFEQVTVKKFRTWAERRQFNRDVKRKLAESERPILPANQKLITLAVQDAPTKKGLFNPRVRVFKVEFHPIFKTRLPVLLITLPAINHQKWRLELRFTPFSQCLKPVLD